MGKKRERAFPRVFHKLLIANIVIGLIPTLVLSLFAVSVNTRSFRRELAESRKGVLSGFVSGADYTLQYLFKDSLERLKLNGTIQTALTYGYSWDNPYENAAVISNEIGKNLQRTNLSLEDLLVVCTLPEYPLYGSRVTSYEIVEKEEWYRAYAESGESHLYRWKRLSNPFKETRYLTLTLVEPIVGTEFNSAYYGKQIGLIKMDIRLDTLFVGLLQSGGLTEGGQSAVAAYNGDGQLLYLSREEYAPYLTEDFLACATNMGSSGQNVRLGAKSAYLIDAPLSDYGLHVLMLFETQSTGERMRVLLGSTILIMCLSILFVIVFSRLSTGRFIRRLNILLRKMERVESGDFTVKEEALGGNDELAVIDRHFNQMVTRLESTINTSYVYQLEKLDAQLSALQLQINPHFLYNTLESVSAIAVTGGFFQIGEVLEKLGEMFRYGVNRESRERVAVREEMRHVENYVFIQKVRFPGKFDVFYNIAPEMEEVQIPFFILQPIVENAILHGGTVSAIEISAQREGESLCLRVQDDGVGMSAQTLSALRDSLNDAPFGGKHGVGLRNVHLRLRLAYGEPYGLTVSATPGGGTLVTARLPIHDEGGSEGNVPASGD